MDGNPMNLKDVLTAKGPRVVTVPAKSSVADAIRKMHTEKVGAVMVPDAAGCPVGILTERDVLNAVAAASDPETVSVEQIMTSDVVTVGPDWDLVEAAGVMARRRIRHLVVYEGGQLLGVLSVRDVLPALLPE